jgi:hypothetical protein
MRKGTHHTPESRLAIRLKRLEASMPPEEFARFMEAGGTLKWCPKCSHLLPVAAFHKNKASWDGLYSRCKTCNAAVSAAWFKEKSQDNEWRDQKNQRAARWREANKGEKLSRSYKSYSLKQLYRITLEQFEVMLAAQDHRCAICERPFADGFDTHVDHDHETGYVRGLLCSHCNNGLGRFRDDPAVLRRAARYLKRNRPQLAAAVRAGYGLSG